MPLLRFPFRPGLLAASLGAAFGTALVVQPLPASAQAAAATYTVRLAAQPLAAALNELSRQTGLQVLAASHATAGLQAPAVAGTMTAEAALQALLAGTPLRASRTTGGAFIVERAPATPERESRLPDVRVSAAAQEGATGYVAGVAARRSATATKTDTPLIETPQSISVVGAREVEQLKAQTLMDALGYVAGVARVEGADRTTESLLLRGFEAWADNGSLYRDGTRYGVNLNNGTQEPYGLERIEVLKGAASVLYGAAAPGGIINTVSKRPTAEPLRELNVEAGSFRRRQVSGDFAGKLDDASADWTYRLTFLARDSDTFVDHVPNDRLYIAPALKWQPSAATSFTLLTEFQRDRTAYIYGLPAEGTVLPNPNGRLPASRFLGEPGFDRYDNRRGSIGYLFEHRFDERLTLRHSVRLYRQSNARPFTYYTELRADQRQLARGVVDARDDSKAATTDTSLQYRWTGGRVAHTLLGGLDYTYQDHRQTYRTGDVADLDLFAPAYGTPIGALADGGQRAFRDRKLGLYLQDQMKIDDRWVVLLGGRQDVSRNGTRAAAVPAADWVNERNNAFTGRAGVVYLVGNGLAPFISYSQSFEPTAGIDSLTGARLKPTRGDQVELGVRYQPDGDDLLLSATVYQLKKVNAVVYDPAANPRQVGEARSRGLELEARTRVGAASHLVAAYAYTDARSLDPYLSAAFTRTGGVPQNQLSLWLDHDFRGLGLPGLQAGAGVRHVDRTTASYLPGVVVPAFTLVDAMLGYTTGPWRLALNATNLGDRRYVASCTYGCFFGEPRKWIGTLTYRW